MGPEKNQRGISWTLVSSILPVLFAQCGGYPNGPPYPITASWFRDRFTSQEWNRTLAEFQQQGGDTVFLRAPSIARRTRDDLMRDEDFTWCGSSYSSSGVQGPHCYDEAVQELRSYGLNVTALVTYEYEEGFSDDIMLCPRVDRKINSSRIYYRIVLPAGPQFNESNVCDFPSGTDVVLLLTSFAGTDAHGLLLSVAAERNMSVFFGLPAVPADVDAPQHRSSSRAGIKRGDYFDTALMGAYYGWVYRVLHEHQARYSEVKVKPGSADSVYNKSLGGYYSTDECCLAQVNSKSPFVSLYGRLGQLVHGYAGKRMAVSPFIDLNRSNINATVTQHVTGFQTIATSGHVDIIAVQEGRGAGKGCYYWPTQQQLPVNRVDKVLDRILHYLDPNLPQNVTFGQACSASNQELFGAFEEAHDDLERTDLYKFDFWLNVEAFEYLRDDPCLPVDPASSGMGELLNRASKSRVDRALTVAGGKVQKVISFAWDSDFTCTTRQYNSSLAAQIRADASRPILVNCSFHSPANRSIVVIGHGLLGAQPARPGTAPFSVNWPARGKRRVDRLYGYYFETDWGPQHNRLPSLVYIQMYDLPNVLVDLDPKGWVSVKVDGSFNECIFEYDFEHLRVKGW